MLKHAAALVLIGAALVALSGIWTNRPLDSHEIFVAQTAREMAASGEYIVPSYNDQPRLQKPPLMYWLTLGVSAATGRFGEIDPWVARLASALASIMFVGLTVALGSTIYTRQTGLLAGAMSATSIGYFTYAQSARPEMLYAACCALGLLGFAKAWSEPTSRRASFLWALVGWVGMGLALLAKGPQLPLMIVLGLIVHALVARNWRLVRATRPWMALIVIPAFGLAWALAVAMREPGAWDYWMGQLFSGRTSDPDKGLLNHLSPYYLYSFPALLLPWSVLLPSGLIVSWTKEREHLHAGRPLFWIVIVTVALMGLATHRRGYYMLPILGAMSVLMAQAMLNIADRWASAPSGEKMARVLPYACLGLAATVLGTFAIFDLIAGESPIAELAGIVLMGVALIAARQTCSVATASARLVAPLAVMLVFIMGFAGHERLFWSAKRYERADFARAVTERIGSDAVLLTYRVDPAHYIYARNAPVGRLELVEDPLEVTSGETVWIVCPLIAVDALRDFLASPDAHVVLEQEGEGVENRKALVRVGGS